MKAGGQVLLTGCSACLTTGTVDVRFSLIDCVSLNPAPVERDYADQTSTEGLRIKPVCVWIKPV